LRRKVEALMVPDKPIVVLQLDGLAACRVDARPCAGKSGHIARISAYRKVVNFEQISIRKWPHVPLDRYDVFLEVWQP
jgi:hypothetical protein